MKKLLIIFEMANNHMGDFEHGKRMIDKFSVFVEGYPSYIFAWKFQFRDLDTFIHKDYKNKTDHKYVKRFSETRLTPEQFIELKKYAQSKGFVTMCTGFDEKSIDLIDNMNFDILKVASCSFTDWPLLNRVVKFSKDIILSTAGATVEEIDRVVSFMQHRNKNFALMHCVGEYPTKCENLQLNQIDFLRNRYPGMPVGYSTHEEPEEYEAVQIAIGKGVKIIEKHVAVATEEYIPNAYSVTPEQMNKWLQKATKALEICGVEGEKSVASEKELADLKQFKRAVFAKHSIKKGDHITREDVYYAWPSVENQLLANDMSKYNQFIALEDIEADKAIMNDKINTFNVREKIWDVVQKVKQFLSTSGVVYPGKAELEISHHYGLNNFYETGITMITVVNREYCKKLIIALPGQSHPEQYHKQKEETFVILYGEVELILDGVSNILKKGDVVTIEKGVRHKFITNTGCIIEEVSSTHYVDDSYYTDESISQNPDRKTFVTHWI